MAFGDKYRKEKKAIIETKVPDTLPSAIKDSMRQELSEDEARKLRQQERIDAFNEAVKEKIKEKSEQEEEQKEEKPKQVVQNSAVHDRITSFLKNTRSTEKPEKKKRKGLLGIEYDKVLYSFAKIRVMKTWDYYDQSNVCMQVQCFCQEYHFEITDDEIIVLVQKAYKDVKLQADKHVPFK